MTASYVAVLRTPHASRTFTLALLGRLSYGTVFPSLTLTFTASTGSHAQAGDLLALLDLSASVLMPLRAALIDRHGPRRTLPPVAAAYTLALATLARRDRRDGSDRRPAGHAAAAGLLRPRRRTGRPGRDARARFAGTATRFVESRRRHPPSGYGAHH